MNLYGNISDNLKETWDISLEKRKKMYNFISSVYGKEAAKKRIDNINTVTDEKLERLYNSALKKFNKAQQKPTNKGRAKANEEYWLLYKTENDTPKYYTGSAWDEKKDNAMVFLTKEEAEKYKADNNLPGTVGNVK